MCRILQKEGRRTHQLVHSMKQYGFVDEHHKIHSLRPRRSRCLQPWILMPESIKIVRVWSKSSIINAYFAVHSLGINSCQISELPCDSHMVLQFKIMSGGLFQRIYVSTVFFAPNHSAGSKYSHASNRRFKWWQIFFPVVRIWKWLGQENTNTMHQFLSPKFHARCYRAVFSMIPPEKRM